MKLPKVSILIPVYNRAGLIGECIQSALDQTFTDLEVVVVDNASNDGTWSVCQAYAAGDARVRIFRNDGNIGPVGNWLRCAEEARGEYGKILFSDDLMYPRFLEHALPHLEDTDVAFVSTAVVIGETPASGSVYFMPPGGEQRLISRRYFDLLVADVVLPYSPAAAIFRMADIRENLLGTIPTKIPHDFAGNGAGPDVLLYALTALKYPYVVMLSDLDMYFRAHAGSITMSDRDSAVLKGYYAALAWFFRYRLDRRAWARYIARVWLYELKRQHRLISMRRFCATYEGDGSLSELARVSWHASHESLTFLWRRCRPAPDAKGTGH
jgi:glycosyltransferase involved in cell wall biosynthesis